MLVFIVKKTCLYQAMIAKYKPFFLRLSMLRFFLVGIIFFALSLNSLAATIEGIRLSQHNTHTRLVLDLDSGANYKLFTLKKTLDKPDRLVIDIENGKQINSIPLPDFSKTPIANIRSSKWGNGLRIVLDLKRPLKNVTSQFLKPYRNRPNRIAVDMIEVPLADKQNVIAMIDEIATPESSRRDIVIAIDPGHGGQDPGALGRYGTKEKDIVLAIAKRLAKLVDDEPGMRPYLTRADDRFVSLRQRIKSAHDNKADMFISIHADAVKNKRAKGASVFVLSERGASSEMARLLADKANAADLANISLEDKDDLLASVLIDLSQTASLEASLKAASSILSKLKRVGDVHKKHVESAAFVVLKSPDIPSVLVETAFISNPDEERKLTSSTHQSKLARAIMSGIRSYFRRNPPHVPNDKQEHIVSGGETLAGIAERYQVSVSKLKAHNKLIGTHLKIGDVLLIPK